MVGGIDNEEAGCGESDGTDEEEDTSRCTAAAEDSGPGQGIPGGEAQVHRGRAHLAGHARQSVRARRACLPKDFKQESGLLLPFVTYFQDPFVAKSDPHKAFDEKVFVAWEPGLTDGPTSSRFAIVDYNADTGTLEPPAVWDEETQTFVGSDGQAARTRTPRARCQFHQVSVWALLQCALAFFEDASALGRTIPWAFEGNRLIVVPHAGYGENAYYDRGSKSLQFYYFGSERGHRLHLPVRRHRQPRVRARRARRHPAALQREQQPADGRLPRVHGRSHRHSPDVEEQHAAPSTGRGVGRQVREGHDAVVARRGVRPGREGPAVPADRARTQTKMGDDGERDEPAPPVRGADRRHVRCLDRARRALSGAGRRTDAPKTRRRRRSGTPPIACSARPSSRSICCLRSR